MASRNSTLFLGLIVAISAITAAAPSNAIVISFDPLSITDMIVIRGIVPCGINVTLSPNGTVPPFPSEYMFAIFHILWGRLASLKKSCFLLKIDKWIISDK